MQSFCRFLMKLWGWKAVSGVMPTPKGIIFGVPHTSAWDFVIAYLYYTSVGGVVHILVKKEFFFWPVGFFLRKMGAIPIDRSKGATVIRQAIDVMNHHDRFHLAITPEGTRDKTTRWKAGFHAIAKGTGATVYLGFFDWGKKEIGWTDTLELSDDPQEDLRKIKAYYQAKGVVGKYRDQYSFED